MNFIANLDQNDKMLLLFGGFQLPFDNRTTKSIKRFDAVEVGEIYEIRNEELRELEAPWLTN